MKRYRFILTFCSFFIFCKNFTYAMEKTQPIESSKQNNIVCKPETFEKTYEKWKSLSKTRQDFLKHVGIFNNVYKNVDCKKLTALEIDIYLREIEIIFLEIYNFFVLDFKFNFGKTIKNIKNLKYDNEEYEHFKKTYNDYLNYYLETNNKTLNIYNNLMEIKIFNCMQYKYINNNMSSYEKLQDNDNWNKHIKNYLYPIYNIKRYKENEKQKRIIAGSVPIQTLNAVVFLKKVQKEYGECFPLDILNGLKAVLTTEQNRSIFYNNVFKIKEKEKNKNINYYLKFCESIDECLKYLDKTIKNIPKNNLLVWTNIDI